MSYAHKQRKKKLKNKEIVFPQGGMLRLEERDKPDDQHINRLVEENYLQLCHYHPVVKDDDPEEVKEHLRQEALSSYTCPLYTNDVYVVFYHKGDKKSDEIIHLDEHKGKMTYLSIKRHDKQPCNDWQDFQTIKNILCGDDSEAIQIYPAEYRLLNTANQYHLIVFPPELCPIPFGFITPRAVLKSGKYPNGAIQNFNGKEYNE